MRSQTGRNALTLLALSGCIVSSVAARELSLEDRIQAQAAIERVYYSHQIGASRPFDQVVTRSDLERQVRDYLARSAALERTRGVRVSSDMLRQEVERMSRRSLMRERLSELYAALGDDPVLIRECLARPLLIRRLAEPEFAPPRAVEPVSAVWLASAGLNQLRGSSASLEVVPEGRREHTAVWTGNEMIVWGGDSRTPWLNTGGRYDPVTDSWSPTSTIDAPAGRRGHKAIWTGEEMIIWGGSAPAPPSYDAAGGRYNPLTDTWKPTSTVNAPAGRIEHSCIWTGREMIVWGGYTGARTFGDGGLYEPLTDTWRPVSLAGAPSARWLHSAVWTGGEMIVWGGFYNPQTGGRYDPATDTWSPTSTMNVPQGRHYHSAVWTGRVMLIWGGYGGADGVTFFADGGQYDPASDTWTPVSTKGAPHARLAHTSVWTGDLLVVWGGLGPDVLNSGGRYDPVADTWKQMKRPGSPTARYLHTAVWTGDEMAIWGGFDGLSTFLDTGGRYSPERNTWEPTSTEASPVATPPLL